MSALKGLKILDFSTLLPGPFATLMLADMGAEVIKISSPDKPDIVAQYPPYIEGKKVSANQAWLGRNKRNLFLNLKKEEAITAVKKLVIDYDIVLEQFRPGVMDKLGLGYEDLRKVNPKLIYCSLTGYGQTGSMAKRAGHDINYLARSGNMDYSGRKETGPTVANMQIADLGSGSLHSIIGILSAVYFREQTGEGQYIDVAMLDGLIPFHAMEGASFLAGNLSPKREETRLNGGSMYDFYETKDGRYLSIGALEPQFWRNFCIAIGQEENIEKTVMPKDQGKTKEKVAKRLKEKTQKEWMEIFKDKDLCVEPVQTMEEALLNDDQIKERNLVVEVEGVKQMATPINLSKCPINYEKIGEPLGYHSEEILRELGYSKEEIKKLEESGVTTIRNNVK